jgi:hypothetical protein
MLDSGGHFGIQVSDGLGRVRAITSASTGQEPAREHVVPRGAVNLEPAARERALVRAPVGIPAQSDVARALRIGGREGEQGLLLQRRDLIDRALAHTAP